MNTLPHTGRKRPAWFLTTVLAGAMVLSTAPVLTSQDQAARIEHGSLDTWSQNGISLAWAILKAEPGLDPANDRIILRIALKDGTAPVVSISGVDPFSGDRKTLPVAPGPGQTAEMRQPRTHFADYPRTEIRFPDVSLTIFYLGIPDTTPEFLDREHLEAYLAERLSCGE